MAVPLMAAGLVTGLAPAAGAAGVPCVSMTGQPPPAGQLGPVAALSPCNVWAVEAGASGIVHWDGATWTASSLPAGPGRPFFGGIDALTASDMWVVGFSQDGPQATQDLIDHWDGSSWKASQETRPGGTLDQLNAVTAISPTNAWAVGLTHVPGGRLGNLIEHWDGTTWTRLPGVPAVGAQDTLTAVAAVSPSDIWAAGTTLTSSGNEGFMLHWDGRKWNQVSIPAVASNLWGLTVVSASNAWAVGTDASETSPGSFTPVILHWDGAYWTRAQLPPGAVGILRAVTATSASDAWAVGADRLNDSTGVVLHWDGTAWMQVPTPASVSELGGVAATTPGNVWAVGADQDQPSGAGNHGVALHLRVS